MDVTLESAYKFVDTGSHDTFGFNIYGQSPLVLLSCRQVSASGFGGWLWIQQRVHRLLRLFYHLPWVQPAAEASPLPGPLDFSRERHEWNPLGCRFIATNVCSGRHRAMRGTPLRSGRRSSGTAADAEQFLSRCHCRWSEADCLPWVFSASVCRGSNRESEANFSHRPLSLPLSLGEAPVASPFCFSACCILPP